MPNIEFAGMLSGCSGRQEQGRPVATRADPGVEDHRAYRGSRRRRVGVGLDVLVQGECAEGAQSSSLKLPRMSMTTGQTVRNPTIAIRPGISGRSRLFASQVSRLISPVQIPKCLYKCVIPDQVD